jgi:hypothetical protein
VQHKVCVPGFADTAWCVRPLLFDFCVAQNMFKILGEDKVMLEQLRPEQIKTELSLEADKPQVAFRKLRQVGRHGEMRAV